MAAVSLSTVLYEAGYGEKVVLYFLKNVTTADTLDVSGKFRTVKDATFVAAGSQTGIGTATATGTSIALTLTGLSSENVYLLVVGQEV